MGTFTLRVLITNLKEQSTPKSPLPVALFITEMVQETSLLSGTGWNLVLLHGQASSCLYHSAEGSEARDGKH